MLEISASSSRSSATHSGNVLAPSFKGCSRRVSEKRFTSVSSFASRNSTCTSTPCCLSLSMYCGSSTTLLPLRTSTLTGLPAGVHPHAGHVVVIQSGARDLLVGKIKAKRFDQMQAAAGVGRQADEVAGV